MFLTVRISVDLLGQTSLAFTIVREGGDCELVGGSLGEVLEGVGVLHGIDAYLALLARAGPVVDGVVCQLAHTRRWIPPEGDGVRRCGFHTDILGWRGNCNGMICLRYDERDLFIIPDEELLSETAVGCTASYFVKIIWCSRWFWSTYFEAVYSFICGHERVAVAQYRMICLVLPIKTKISTEIQMRANIRQLLLVRDSGHLKWATPTGYVHTPSHFPIQMHVFKTPLTNDAQRS